MFKKDYIRKLVTQGEWRNATKNLLELIVDFEDSMLTNQILQINARYETLYRSDIQGTISLDEKTLEKNKIDISLFATIDEVFELLNIKNDHNSNRITLDELNNLKDSRLPYFLEQSGIRSTIQLLKNLFESSSSKLTELKILESEISQNDSKYSFTVAENQELESKNKFEEWRKARDKIKEQVELLISQIQEEDITKSGNWENIYLETLGLGNSDESSSNDIYGLFTPADEITPPKDLNEREKHLFRRLLHRSQDALAVKNYKIAYKCCQEIRDNVEPNSAQLYEYMLLIFAKKEGTENIVREALEGNKNDALVKHLILYAGRYYQFQKSGACASLTGKDNIQEVINGLSNSLRKEYSNIEGDYILVEKDSKEKETQRLKVKKAIRVAFDISYAIPEAPPTSFLNIAFNELSGGGKFDWIEIANITDSGWKLIDKKHRKAEVQLNALTTIKEIETLFWEKYKQKSIDTFSILSQNLLSSLNRRYDEIKNNIKENPYTAFIDKSELVAILIRLINAYQIGFELFNKAKEFLTIPIDELEGRGIFKWAIFNSNGDLIENELCRIHNFQAMEELKHMVNLRDGENIWRSIRTRVREETYKRLEKETEETYKSILRIANIKKMDEEDRKKIIKCLNQWEILYFIKYDEDILNKYLNELVGDRIFLWLDINEEGIISNIASRKLNFRPDFKLARVFGKLNQEKTNDNKKKIASNLLSKDITGNYKTIKRKNEDEREVLLILMERAKNCYKFIFPNRELLVFIYEELIQEVKLQWFDIQDDSIVRFENAYQYDFRLSTLFEDFKELSEAAGLFSEGKLIYAIVEKRYNETAYSYKSDVREFKSQNSIREMETAILIIRKCCSYFKVYPDMKFLEIPKTEFINRDGRIKWSYKFWGREFPTFVTWVGGIYDTYKKDKKKVEALLHRMDLPSDDTFYLPSLNEQFQTNKKDEFNYR